MQHHLQKEISTCELFDSPLFQVWKTFPKINSCLNRPFDYPFKNSQIINQLHYKQIRSIQRFFLSYRATILFLLFFNKQTDQKIKSTQKARSQHATNNSARQHPPHYTRYKKKGPTATTRLPPSPPKKGKNLFLARSLETREHRSKTRKTRVRAPALFVRRDKLYFHPPPSPALFALDK